MAVEQVIASLEQAGCNPRPAGSNRWTAYCPIHERDGQRHRPSLSVGVGETGTVLVHCFAGCSVEAITGAVGLTLADLMPDDSRRLGPNGKPQGNGRPKVEKPAASYETPLAAMRSYRLGKHSAKWPYYDREGAMVGVIYRWDGPAGKTILPVSRGPKGGWYPRAMEPPRPLYRRPELLAADRDEIVYVTEGEKCCDAAAKCGLPAVTSSGGSQAAARSDWSPLAGRRVVILPDNDEAGEKYAADVARLAHAAGAKSVKVLSWDDILPGRELPPGYDIADAVDECRSDIAALRHAIELAAEATPEWTPAAEPWPDIIPIDLGPLPEFPTHALPDVLREWVEAESRATQTPPDLCGLLTLAVCSACIARRVEVEPRPGWREPANLFVAVLAEPGSRKSAVFADTVRPLRDVEKTWIESVRSEVAQAESRRRQDESRLRKLEKLAAEQDDADAARQARELAARLEAEPPPAMPRLIVDDVTPEKLAVLLAEQGGRIASFASEGGPFDIMAGLYANGTPQFNVYLQSHAGDALATDRISRRSVYVERPALTCGYAIQPAVIRGLAEKAVFRARGLLGRFLYAAPRSLLGEREIAAPPVPDAIRESYHRLVHRLAGSFHDSHAAGEPFVLRLTPEAEAMLREWEGEIEAMLADGGELEAIRDWGGKLAGATLRIAGVLHCAMYRIAGTIAASTLAAAITIGRYLIPHAERVLYAAEVSGGGILDDARYLLRWILRSGKREFSKSEAQQNTKRRFPRVEDIEPALGELVKRGYIRPKILPKQEAKSPGRPPSPVFEVNPELSLPTGGKHGFENPEIRPKKPKNSFAANFQVFQGAFDGVENQANHPSVGKTEPSGPPCDGGFEVFQAADEADAEGGQWRF